MPPPQCESRLVRRRGEIRKGEEGRIHFFDEGPVGLGLGFYADPFGVFPEGFPVRIGGLTAGVDEHIDKSFACEGLVRRKPIGEIFEAVFFEELHSVVAEAGEKGIELAFMDVIDAELIDGGGGRGGPGSVERGRKFRQ